jgi:signal transduction histidine kinase
MCPDSSGHNDDNDDNGNTNYDRNKNKSNEILTKNNTDLLTKKSVDIRTKIEEMANANSSLLKLNKELQSRAEILNEKQAHIDGRREIIDYNLDIKKDYNKLNAEISAINEGLGDLNSELVKVNEALIISIDNISNKYEQQREFINIAAHEIRSPSQAILGHAELLNLEPINSKKYLELITRNAERLDLLTSNILDASRIDNKTLVLKMEQFNLVKLIEQIVEDINSRIANEKDKNIKVVCKISTSEKGFKAKDSKEAELVNQDISVIVNADRARITQVIFNLLDNSIKFTKEGKILITLRKNILKARTRTKCKEGSITNELNQGKEGEEGEIIIQINDPGKGINPKILPRLFSKFASDSTTAGGTGLGLFISKNIIEAHGGEIWAKNNENERGALFYFSIPTCLK